MERKFLNDKTFDRIIRITLTVSALIFSLSYAFGQYVRFRESNVLDLDAWINCAKTEQLSDTAYQFCRQKASENYMFKKHYDWGEGRLGADGDE